MSSCFVYVNLPFNDWFLFLVLVLSCELYPGEGEPLVVAVASNEMDLAILKYVDSCLAEVIVQRKDEPSRRSAVPRKRRHVPPLIQRRVAEPRDDANAVIYGERGCPPLPPLAPPPIVHGEVLVPGECKHHPRERLPVRSSVPGVVGETAVRF